MPVLSIAILSGFFDTLWNKPVAGLTDPSKAVILAIAGFNLQALGRLGETAQPMQAGLDAVIVQENWENAARGARNLSELQLTLGNVASALDYVKKSGEYADRSADAFQRIGKGTTLGDTLHQAGRIPEAEDAFVEAEEMLKEGQPDYQYLYSFGGFEYCNLLLSQGKYREVVRRAMQTLEYAKTRDWPRDIALDHLSLGRAYLLQILQDGSNDFSQATEHLNKAVEGLRQAGTQHHLPRGLLARAELHQVRRDFPKAQHDLDEAMTIAERGGMGLHMADCHLEYARLYLAMDEKEEDARKNLDIAKEMIGKMGYHRRDTDVREIEEKLL